METAIKTDNLSLRVVDEDYASLLARWKDDAYMRKMSVGEDARVTIRSEREAIRQAKEEGSSYWIIHVGKDRQAVGYVRCDFIDELRHAVWLRFGLGERRSEGHAKAALQAVIEHLSHRGVQRFEAEVYAFNTPCVKLMESLGFRRERVKKNAHHDKEGFHDIYVYGLLTAAGKESH